jgi:hypothetical protein
MRRKMSKIRLFPGLILAAVFLAACAPAGSSASYTQTTAGPGLTALSATPTPGSTSAEVVTPSPLPLATSRGPELHATDPATVNLASGGLQLVEFFRFT